MLRGLLPSPFFFQAEDGIRDFHVTGVQTCALPIYDGDQYDAPDVTVLSEHITAPGVLAMAAQAEPQAILYAARGDGQLATLTARSEERRVGKESRSRWSP